MCAGPSRPRPDLPEHGALYERDEARYRTPLPATGAAPWGRGGEWWRGEYEDGLCDEWVRGIDRDVNQRPDALRQTERDTGRRLTDGSEVVLHKGDE